MDLYVYYKVADADAAALAPRVRALQAALAAAHGVAVQRKRRPGSKDGLQTWMEVYPDVPASFEETLAQAVAQAGLGALIQGPRRAEVFVELEQTPCA